MLGSPVVNAVAGGWMGRVWLQSSTFCLEEDCLILPASLITHNSLLLDFTGVNEDFFFKPVAVKRHSQVLGGVLCHDLSWIARIEGMLAWCLFL